MDGLETLAIRRSSESKKIDSSKGSVESTPYDEYYAIDAYCQKADGDETYAKRHTGDEYYLEVDDVPRYARKTTSDGTAKPYVARSVEGTPSYPLNESGDVVFPIVDGKKTYAIDDRCDEVYPNCAETGDEIYMKDEYGNQVPALDARGRPRYAVRRIEGPVPPVDKDGNPMYLSTEIEYALNAETGRPQYTRDARGGETYARVRGKEIYGLDVDGNERYALDSNGNEIMALDADDVPYYCVDKFKNQVYPKYNNGDEYYRETGTLEDYARKNNGDGYYAKLASGNEFYPKQSVSE